MDAPEVVSQKLDRRTHLASGLISGFLAGLGWVLLPSPGKPFAYLRILPPMLVLYAVQELYRWARFGKRENHSERLLRAVFWTVTLALICSLGPGTFRIEAWLALGFCLVVGLTNWYRFFYYLQNSKNLQEEEDHER